MSANAPRPTIEEELKKALAERDAALTLAGGLQADNRNLRRLVEALTLELDAVREAAALAVNRA